MSAPPFIVFGLPRSRTAWLARLLTYGDWVCGHEEARHARSLEDIRSWFSQPNIGTAETAAAPFWRNLRSICPELRAVVIRRPQTDVMNSLTNLPVAFDREALEVTLRHLDRKLDQIESRWPGALSVQFSELVREDVCARVFENCLPYQHDPAWWRHWAPINVQCNMPALMRHFQAFRPQMERLAAQLRTITLTGMARRLAPERDDVTIQCEDFDTFFRDGQTLFREHLAAVGEHPEAFWTKNVEIGRALDRAGALQIVTGRSNGRMFGYLVTVVGPSFERAGGRVGVATAFFASPAVPGLGRRIQWAAKEYLRSRGVEEAVFRAGVRGDGPRLGALYRRMGAEPHGELYRLLLKDAV